MRPDPRCVLSPVAVLVTPRTGLPPPYVQALVAQALNLWLTPLVIADRFEAGVTLPLGLPDPHEVLALRYAHRIGPSIGPADEQGDDT